MKEKEEKNKLGNEELEEKIMSFETCQREKLNTF